MYRLENKYYHAPDNDLVAKGIITQDEMDYRDNLKIPGNAGLDAWQRKYEIDAKIIAAIGRGEVPEHIPAGVSDAGVYVISDSMGVHGIQSQADGKYYDSKSKYRAELKSQGMIEMGSDAPTKARTELRGDFDVRKELSQAIDRVCGV